jgi:hypothetical protein
MLVWGACLSLLVFAGKAPVVGSAARLITPYYPLLVLPLVRGCRMVIVQRRRWWKLGVWAVFAVALTLMVLAPARPLWPALLVLDRLQAARPGDRLIARSRTVYATYRVRADGFAPVLALLPPDAQRLGLVSFDDPEAPLWKPFGTRRVEHVTSRETPQAVQDRGIRYILVKVPIFEQSFGRSVTDWLSGGSGRILWTIPLRLRASEPPSEWALVHLGASSHLANRNLPRSLQARP